MPEGNQKNAANADQSQTMSACMARFAATLTYDQLPADVREIGRRVLLDGLGCALAGSTTEELRLIRQAMLDASGNTGDTQLWGTTQRVALPLAVLANAAATHAREMDDFEGCLHSGAVIIPAAFSTAARLKTSGRELITAIVVGYDIARRALEGGGGNQAFKQRGWHSTSTCGGFGAAAAVGRLLQLNSEQLQWALGYAGSNAGGTWAFVPDGAMSKRVHPGFAAQSGVVSAYLAAQGVTAPTQIFEAEWGGFFPTYVGDRAKPQKAIDGLGSDFRIRVVGFKPYAACRGTHGSIDAILELRSTENIRAEAVAQVLVRGSRTHIKQLAKQEVKTMLDAQFSLPYSIAVSLATGRATLDQYTPEAVRRPEIAAIARRVEVLFDERVRDGEQPFVEVHLTDGRVLSKRVLIPRGDHMNPLTEDELLTKFRANAGTVLDPSEVTALEEAVTHITDIGNVDAVATLLTPHHAKGT